MNVMITSAGRRDYLVEYFQEALEGDGLVVATDASPDASALARADLGLVVPPFHDPEYLPTVLRFVHDHGIDLLLSVNDDDLMVLCHARAELLGLGCLPMVSSPSVVHLAMDKLQLGSFCRLVGIAYPTTYATAEDALAAVTAGRERFPLVVKPRFGSGSRATHVVHGPEELDAAVRLATAELSRLVRHDAPAPVRQVLVQKHVDGVEHGLDVVNDHRGTYVTTFARRKLQMRHGETDRASTVVDERFDALGQELSAGLRHVGCLDCDVLVVGDDLVLLDVNPRFGGGYPFSHAAGADLPRAYLDWARGRTPDPEQCLSPRPDVAGAKSARVHLRPSEVARAS